MKNILLIPAIAVVLALAAPLPLGAAEPRIFVALFESSPQDEDLARKASVAAAKQISRSKGFDYISPYKLTSIVTGKKELSENAPADLADQYSRHATEVIQEAAKPVAGTFSAAITAMTAPDLIIGGKISRNGALVRIEMTMARIKTSRETSITIECPEQRIESEVQGGICSLLKKVALREKVYADRTVDAELSKVAYEVRAVDDRYLTIEFDYTGDRPAPQVQNAGILPPDGLARKGTSTFTIRSAEGKDITVEFAYKVGKLDSVRINAPVPDASNKGDQSETLTLKSKAGYLLDFGFAWKNGELTKAHIAPKINPFTDDSI